MDRKDGEHASSLNAYRAAIVSGQMSTSETIAQLKASVRLEEEKPYNERDYEWITALEELQYELRTGTTYQSRKEESYKRIKSQLAAQEQRQSRLRPVKRLAIVLASMLLLVIGGELVRREWLSGKPTDDEQQYVIQGNRIDTSIIEDGIADSDPDLKQITTKSYEKAVAFWGKEPTLPKWLPEGWEIYEYSCSLDKVRNRFTTIFVNSMSHEKVLQVEQREYADAELVNMLIEQSQNGKYVEVDNRSLYILKNLDVIEAVWFKEQICFTVHGQLEESQIVRIVTSMKE